MWDLNWHIDGIQYPKLDAIIRCVHANLAVCLDCFGTGGLRTTKMFQIFPIFYIELRASRTFYWTRPREIPSNLSCWNEISSVTSVTPCWGPHQASLRPVYITHLGTQPVSDPGGRLCTWTDRGASGIFRVWNFILEVFFRGHSNARYLLTYSRYFLLEFKYFLRWLKHNLVKNHENLVVLGVLTHTGVK